MLRVTTVATAPASTTFTRIDGWCAYFDEDVNRAEYFVDTAITPPNATPAVGDNVIDRLECNGLTKLSRLFITCPPATGSLTDATGAGISYVKVEVDGRVVFDMTRAATTQFMHRSPLYYALTTEYGFIVPFNANNDARDFADLHALV